MGKRDFFKGLVHHRSAQASQGSPESRSTLGKSGPSNSPHVRLSSTDVQPASNPVPTVNPPISTPGHGSQTSSPVTTSRNRSLELAIQEHLQSLPGPEKAAFEQASKSLDEAGLMSHVRAYDNSHKENSFFRPQADRVAKILGFVNRFMDVVSLGLQAAPAPASLAVGAVRIVINTGLQFSEFFSKLVDMLSNFEDYEAPLTLYARTAEASDDLDIVHKAVAEVYGVLLSFCQKARRVFVHGNGERRNWTSLTTFIRLQWEPFEAEFAPLKAEMDHHLDVLLQSAQASQLSLTHKLLQMEEITDRRREKTAFLDWMSSFGTSKVDFEKAHDEKYAKRHEHTGDWLLQTKEFQSWTNSTSSSLLWCNGKPGIGKSILASHIIEALTSLYGLAEHAGICFAYYDYRNEELRDLSLVLAALIKQLCRRKEVIPSWLLKFRQESASRATVAKSESFLKLADEEFTSIYIVFDALDECPKEARHYIIRFISELVSRNKESCAIKIFVTSRGEKDIATAFGTLKMRNIDISAKNVSGDLAKFVRSETSKLRQGYNGKKLYVQSDDLAEKIIQTLIDKADGMFLWVDLQLKTLCEVSEMEEDQLVEDALGALPEGLSETYVRILDQIEKRPKQIRELALNCLMWTLYARRPFAAEFGDEGEFNHALMASTLSKTAKDRPVPTIRVALEACGNLLMLEGHKVRPIHYSVQEFLINPHETGVEISNGLLRQIADPIFANAKMAAACLNYILSKNFAGLYMFPYLSTQFAGVYMSDTDLAKRPPIDLRFTHYAIHNFDHHVLQSGAQSDCLQLVEQLLGRNNDFLWVVLTIRIMSLGDFQDFYDETEGYGYEVTAESIVYASRIYEIPEVQLKWLSDNPPPKSLCRACTIGNFDAVVKLLELGSDANELERFRLTELEGSPYYTALQYAARGGHWQIVELLLTNGADAKDQNAGDSGRSLRDASYAGQDGVVRLLIEAGAEVNGARPDADFDVVTPLQAAAQKGHARVVETLLEARADPNLVGKWGGPLHNAADGGHEDVVALLISKGGDVNVRTTAGHMTALDLASSRGHWKIVELLEAAGAN